MESKILKSLGIDPAYIFLFLIMLIILMFLLYINVNMKYNRLKSSYNVFMRGQDGKTLEESFIARFNELDELSNIAHENIVSCVAKQLSESRYCKIRCFR